MTTLIHVADLHIGRPVRYGRDDTPGVVARLVDLAIERRPDLVLIAGDTFDNRHPAPADLDVFARAMKRLSDAGIRTIVTSGNHDSPTTVADARTHTLLWANTIDLPGITISLKPEVIETPTAMVITMPYPHKRAYDGVMHDADAMMRMEAIAADVDVLIADLAARSDGHPGPRIFVGHLSVSGATVGSERAMRLEDDVTISADALRPFHYAALGHIHKQQAVAPNAWYAGSLEYIDFGEAGQDKGFLLVDVSTTDLSVTRIGSAPRPMATVDLESVEDTLPLVPEDAIVRVRVKIDSGSTEGLRRVIRDTYMEAGASHVQVEFVLPERTVTSTRAITKPMTDREALMAYLRSRDLPYEPYVSAAAALEES